MFQHKGAGKQEVGQPSERGLSCKSHISAHVCALSSPKRSAEIGVRNGIESLTVKFGFSLKFKNKCSPRGQGALSDHPKFRMQDAKEKHPLLKSSFSSASSVLCSPTLSPDHLQHKARSGQLFCTRGVCAEAPHMFLTRNRVRVWPGLLQSGWHSFACHPHCRVSCIQHPRGGSLDLELFAQCL